MFWCGEDKIIYGSATPIWHLKRALDAFWDFEIPHGRPAKKVLLLFGGTNDRFLSMRGAYSGPGPHPGVGMGPRCFVTLLLNGPEKLTESLLGTTYGEDLMRQEARARRLAPGNGGGRNAPWKVPRRGHSCPG
jgi:hypothetical protein